MVERRRIGGVSAQAVLATVRVHLDRVHDLVRRLDCPSDAAVEVVARSAHDLVRVVAERPAAVPDAVGWWIARACVLVGEQPTVTDDVPVGGGVLAVDGDQEVLAEALDQLPERERVALLLRDSYDLPVASVAAALSIDGAGAMELVGRARLAFLPLVDGEPARAFEAAHGSLASLARLGEGGAVAPRDATMRRHALTCPSCREATDAQQRAHLLLAGLTVVAVRESERSELLDGIQELAAARLPSASELQVAAARQDEIERERADQRLLSPLLALAGIVLAILAGLGVGLLLSRDGGSPPLAGADGNLPAGIGLLSPSPVVAQVQRAPRTVVESPPETSVFVIASPSPPPPPPKPSPSPVSQPVALSITPTSGSNGTSITVQGSGFTPGLQVTIDYVDPEGKKTGTSATAVPEAGGGFTVTIEAQDPENLPGRHVVQASNGEQTATASFTATA